MNEIGIEIPSINSLKRLKNMIASSKKYDLVVNQYNEVLGSRLIPKSEKIEMLACARENKVGLTFSISTRPEYDVDSSFYKSEWGKVQARRIDGEHKLNYSINEVLELIDLGCTGVILYDLGLLSLLNKLRNKNKIPSSFKFKISSHCAITNSESAHVYASNGADDIIPLHDISLSSLQEIRAKNPKLILSIIIDTYKNKGGFIRMFDLNTIIDIEGTIFLKTGNSLHQDPYGFQIDDTDKVMRRIKAITESITNPKYEEKKMCIGNLNSCIPL